MARCRLMFAVQYRLLWKEIKEYIIGLHMAEIMMLLTGVRNHFFSLFMCGGIALFYFIVTSKIFLIT